MSAAVSSIVFGFVIAVLAPPLLLRISRAGSSPRAALLAWLSALGLTAASWAAAVIALIVDFLHHRLFPSNQPMMDACVTQLHDAAVGGYGDAVRVGAFILAALTVAAGAVLTVRLVRSLWTARRTTFTHARMARIAGRHSDELDAVVLDVDEPAAYCVAGKPHTVVVTRGALSALDERQVEAVLAHERAHLDGRHHLLLAVTRGLAAALPRIGLFTTGAREVARLLELIADDAAVRSHGRGTVLCALLTLAAMEDAPVGAADAGLSRRIRRLSGIR
ncbi:M56 family metallopeptidase [Nocardia sp. CC227C]|uniref:M56 family metallopeptidase n=1 Tax=Nocardia sp. CC227C TaxID=3044562 RepID=UPI00278BF11C|nr:M56 family metallopeptidase [Nocardia sp. CC227C]